MSVYCFCPCLRLPSFYRILPSRLQNRTAESSQHCEQILEKEFCNLGQLTLRIHIYLNASLSILSISSNKYGA
jgi:hypothetical protein